MSWFWSTTGHWYAFWSGFGSCLSEFSILGLVFHHFNCHARGCWRIGHHKVDGTPYTVCRKHHPTMPDKRATLEQIHASVGVSVDTAPAKSIEDAVFGPSKPVTAAKPRTAKQPTPLPFDL